MTMHEPALPPEKLETPFDPRCADGQYTVYTPADCTGLALNLEVLGALFEAHDREGAGGLTLDEFKARADLRDAAHDQVLEAAFHRADVNRTGDVGFAELRAWFEDEINGDTLLIPAPAQKISQRSASEEWLTVAGRVIKARVGDEEATRPRGLFSTVFACGGASAAVEPPSVRWRSAWWRPRTVHAGGRRRAQTARCSRTTRSAGPSTRRPRARRRARRSVRSRTTLAPRRHPRGGTDDGGLTPSS